MHLDIIAQRYISAHTTVPLPHIHAFSLDSDNKIGRPYTIIDFLPGTNLSKVWNDKNWISLDKRGRILEQIAGWMTELAALEFDRIGRLDVDTTTGRHYVVPFPDAECLLTRRQELDPKPTESFGPFDSSLIFLHALLEKRRQTDESAMLALLQLFLSALSDISLDGAPFTLFPPDFDSQNVLVADDATVTGLIDWDGVYVGPRQGGAAAYPAWLTVDWDPTFYGWSKDNSADQNSEYDSPEELHSYRKRYLDAIDRASAGALTRTTRNSHVWSALHIAITNAIASGGIVDHLSKFVFGSSLLGFQVEEGIGGGPWYRLQQGVDLIAQVDEGELCFVHSFFVCHASLTHIFFMEDCNSEHYEDSSEDLELEVRQNI
jgi:hypothetical protein